MCNVNLHHEANVIDYRPTQQLKEKMVYLTTLSFQNVLYLTSSLRLITLLLSAFKVTRHSGLLLLLDAMTRHSPFQIISSASSGFGDGKPVPTSESKSVRMTHSRLTLPDYVCCHTRGEALQPSAAMAEIGAQSETTFRSKRPAIQNSDQPMSTRIKDSKMVQFGVIGWLLFSALLQSG
jgi:hypothetical protein